MGAGRLDVSGGPPLTALHPTEGAQPLSFCEPGSSHLLSTCGNNACVWALFLEGCNPVVRSL